MVFELEPVETQIILLLFSSDPILFDPGRPPGKTPHSKEADAEEEDTETDQTCLRDALQESRNENRVKAGEFLRRRLRKRPNAETTLLTLPSADLDWLLQMLNEIRVGSWYALNCPDEHEEPRLSKNPEHLHHVLRLDFSGMLQSLILAAYEAT